MLLIYKLQIIYLIYNLKFPRTKISAKNYKKNTKSNLKLRKSSNYSFFGLKIVAFSKVFAINTRKINNKYSKFTNNMRGALLLIFALGIIRANCLFLPVTSRPLCINIEEEPSKQVHFFYEVTGNNPENMKVDFQPLSGRSASFSLSGQSGKTKYIQENMKVCFISTDGGYKSVSIDFYIEDVAHLAQLAKKSDLYELHTKLISVGEKIKDVNRNQIFEEERQSIHGRIIEQHENKLKILVVIKLAAIILVAIAQIYLLKSMLSKSSQGYQPV